jgi:hypothetical protein
LSRQSNVISIRTAGGGVATSRPVKGTLHTLAGSSAIVWQVPEEVPIAILFNSQNHAVMMGTPADFEDFAIGFAIAEGIVAKASDIDGILVLPSEQGFAVDLSVKEEKLNRSRMAKRSLEGRTGCGLCGIEDIKDAIRMPGRPVPDVQLSPQAVARAYEELPRHQPMSRINRTVHAAAWCSVRRRNPVVARGCRPPQCSGQADRRIGSCGNRSRFRLCDDVEPLQFRARPEMRHRRHRRARHRLGANGARPHTGNTGPTQARGTFEPRRHDFRQGIALNGIA